MLRLALTFFSAAFVFTEIDGEMCACPFLHTKKMWAIVFQPITLSQLNYKYSLKTLNI